MLLLTVACGNEDPGTAPSDASPDAFADAGRDALADATPDATPDAAPLPRLKPWERMPGLEYLGGALLTAPKIVTITFAGDDAQLVSRLTTFDDTITQTPWWTAATSEYCIQPANTPCIGPGTSGGHVVLPGPAPTSLKDTIDGAGSTVMQLLQDHIFSGELPAPDAQTLYVLYFPAGTTITMDGMTSCSSFGAYHYSADLTPLGSTSPSRPPTPSSRAAAASPSSPPPRATRSSRPPPTRTRAARAATPWKTSAGSSSATRTATSATTPGASTP